jgi:hypothetical protein
MMMGRIRVVTATVRSRIDSDESSKSKRMLMWRGEDRGEDHNSRFEIHATHRNRRSRLTSTWKDPGQINSPDRTILSGSSFISNLPLSPSLWPHRIEIQVRVLWKRNIDGRHISSLSFSLSYLSSDSRSQEKNHQILSNE